MEPAIKTGSLIITHPQGDYYVGDVVTRKTNEEDTTFTHRIIEKKYIDEKIFFMTQGDANNSPDVKIVSQDMIVGKVLFDLPYMGYIVSFAQTKSGILIFVVLPALAILVQEFFVLKKELQKRWMKKTPIEKASRNEILIDETIGQFTTDEIVLEEDDK
jgi:signal peptidase I